MDEVDERETREVSSAEGRPRRRGGGPRGGAVVTGASSGIGAAVAEALAREGYRTFGTYRDPSDAAALEEAGVDPVRLDVTEADSVDSARRVVGERLGSAPLRVLVNNAGIPGAGPLELVPLDDVRAVLEVNVVGVLAVTRAFLPALRESGGTVVMMSSVSGRMAMPFAGPYAASKHALEGLSDSLRRELGPLGVDVLVVEPGSVATPIWNRVAALDLAPYEDTPYGPTLKRVRAAALEAGRGGIAPERVADRVVGLLRSRTPRARTVVAAPRDALRFRLLRWLPDRWLDRVIERHAWR